MKAVTSALAWLMFLLSPLCLAAQSGAGGTTGTPKLKPEEIKKLAGLLGDYWGLSRYDKHYKPARKRFLQGLDQLADAYKPATRSDGKSPRWEHLLAMVDSWSKVFGLMEAKRKLARIPGAGSAKTDRVENLRKGQPVGFEYAYLVPRHYTRDKAWPLIISLPPIGVEGRHYLKHVWLSKKVDKAERAKFIILVPTLSRKTRPHNKRKAETISGFGLLRVLNIYWPVRALSQRLNIDPNRIYLEGTGSGGQIALELASVRTKDFAAVAVRNTVPGNTGALANLGRLPVRLFTRKGEALLSGKATATHDAVLKIAADQSLDLTLVPHEVMDAKAKRKTKRNQYLKGNDVIPEATPAILAAFGKAVRNPYPLKVHFLCTSRLFRRGPWFKLESVDLDAEKSVFPVVDLQIDRSKNTIDISEKNCVRIALFLNDRLIDMDRLVKVVVNGKTLVEEKSDRSMDAMFSYFRNNPLDPAVVVTREIRVRIPQDEETDGKKEGEKKSKKDG